MPSVTIFTPTYNRAHLLRRLHESLKAQTCPDFEWIVVDDGSADNTSAVVKNFASESTFNIDYRRQANAGKHAAINAGLAIARGRWFFIVDSDDLITPDAVEWIIREGRQLDNDNNFAGLSGICVRPDGTRTGGEMPFDRLDSDAISVRHRQHVVGDLAEIYKTDVLRRYPFPVIEGECFCPEAMVWNRIALDGLGLRYINHPIYICEYLADGLTVNYARARKKAPRLTCQYYAETLRLRQPSFLFKLRQAINYWRFVPYIPCGNRRPSVAWHWWLSRPLSLPFIIKDRKI